MSQKRRVIHEEVKYVLVPSKDYCSSVIAYTALIDVQTVLQEKYN